MTKPLDLDALTADVVAAAAIRRARGDYPPGLEAELDEHYRLVSGRSSGSATDALSAIDAFTNRPPLVVPTDIDTSSSMPGGTRVHRVVGGTVTRHQAALITELNEMLAALNATLRAIAATLDPWARIEAEIAGRLDAIEGRLADLQRRANDG